MPVVMFEVIDMLDFKMKIHKSQDEAPENGGSGEICH